MGESAGRPSTRPPVVVLFGPTGIGKTEIAVSLALALGAEIVSADSMQVYRGLPIVTNQPGAGRSRGVRRHLVAIVAPAEEFSVARYARLAHAAVDDILGRGRVAILEGGSGLYVRAALGGLTFGVAPSAARRAELARLLAEAPDELVRRLRELDPDTAARIDIANPRRVLRALETVTAQGGPLTARQCDRLWTMGPAGGARYEHRFFGLDHDRPLLRQRLDARVEAMLAAGLVDELRRASAGGLSRTVRQAIGVAEILAYLDGDCPLEDAVAGMKSRTRRYARRQLTWMRRIPDAGILQTSGRPPDEVADEIRGRLS